MDYEAPLIVKQIRNEDGFDGRTSQDYYKLNYSNFINHFEQRTSHWYEHDYLEKMKEKSSEIQAELKQKCEQYKKEKKERKERQQQYLYHKKLEELYPATYGHRKLQQQELLFEQHEKFKAESSKHE